MKKNIILLISCLFVILHFVNLSRYLINFPNWGDDFTFLAYFNDLPNLGGIEFWKRSTEFHGFIHRMVGARLITAFYHFFSDEFNFKIVQVERNFVWEPDALCNEFLDKLEERKAKSKKPVI